MSHESPLVPAPIPSNHVSPCPTRVHSSSTISAAYSFENCVRPELNWRTGPPDVRRQYPKIGIPTRHSLDRPRLDLKSHPGTVRPARVRGRIVRSRRVPREAEEDGREGPVIPGGVVQPRGCRRMRVCRRWRERDIRPRSRRLCLRSRWKWARRRRASRGTTSCDFVSFHSNCWTGLMLKPHRALGVWASVLSTAWRRVMLMESFGPLSIS